MAVLTVHLDEDSEKLLQQLVEETGQSISTVLKQGLLALGNRSSRLSQRTAYEIYEELDLGPGGYAVAPSTESRRGVQAVRRKLAR
jgi:Ribbon-helix-helix protein, copG family